MKLDLLTLLSRNEQIAFVSDNSQVSCINTTSMGKLSSYPLSNPSLAKSPNDDFLVLTSVSNIHIVNSTNVSNLMNIKIFTIPTTDLINPVISYDSKTLLVLDQGLNRGAVFILDITDLNNPIIVASYNFKRPTFKAAAFSSNYDQLYIMNTGFDYGVYIMNLSNHTNFYPHCSNIGCLAPNGICNMTTGKCQSCLNSTCESPTPYCDAVSGTCFACKCNSSYFCTESTGYCHLLFFYFNMTPRAYYMSSKEYNVTIVNLNVSTGAVMNWSLSQPIPFIQSDNMITLYTNNLPFFSQLLIQVTDGPYTSQFFYVPCNAAPSNGYLSVSPLQGANLLTLYSFEARDYVDVDLPLSYKFGYFYDDPANISLFKDEFSFNSVRISILRANSNHSSSQIMLSVYVKDNYDAIAVSNNSTICKNQPSDLFLSQSITLIPSILSSNHTTDLTQFTYTVDQFVKQLSSIESSSYGNESSSCPLCSNNGKCPININQCFCNDFWTGSVCNINKTISDQIIQIKLSLLDAIASMTNSSGLANETTKILDSLRDMTNNSDFNSKDSIIKILSILQNFFNVTDPSTVLSPRQMDQVSTILDNSYNFLSNESCKIPFNDTQKIMNSSMDIFDLLGNSVEKDYNYSSDGVSIVKENFELRTKLASICELSSLEILSQSYLTPDLLMTMNNNSLSSLNCSKKISVNFLAINSNLLSCNNTAMKFFSTISIKILDQETRQPIKLKPNVTLSFKSLDYVVCEDPCLEDGLECFCFEISMFDVKNQLASIFLKSQLNKINFSEINLNVIVKSIGVWTLLVIALITLFSIIFLQRFEHYDILTRAMKKNKKLAAITKIKLSYMLLQSFIVIYVKKDNVLPKTIRMYLFYLSMLAFLAYNSIFGLDEKLQIPNLSEFMLSFDFSFNPYISILPYFTIVPLTSMITYFIKKLWTKKADNSSEAMGRIVKFSENSFLNLITALILSKLSTGMVNQWIFNLMIFYIQEFLIIPFTGILILWLKNLLLRVNYIKKSGKVKKFIESTIDKDVNFMLFEYQRNLFARKVKRSVARKASTNLIR